MSESTTFAPALTTSALALTTLMPAFLTAPTPARATRFVISLTVEDELFLAFGAALFQRSLTEPGRTTELDRLCLRRVGSGWARFFLICSMRPPLICRRISAGGAGRSGVGTFPRRFLRAW